MQTESQNIEQQQPEAQEPRVKTVPFAAISKVAHIQADNVYIKSTYVPRQVKFYTKQTPDSHVAILAHGEILMLPQDADPVRYRAPASYVIPANSRIAFVTLEDCVFYCVHATQETDLDVLDNIY
jgi:hypothetical protein